MNEDQLNNIPNWLKAKGYLHLTPQIDVLRKARKIVRDITNPEYVSRYSFFPLIYCEIKERRYKRVDKNSRVRAHKVTDKQGNTRKTAKKRPLHYAAHMDALIYGYYAELIQDKYDGLIKRNGELDNAITAYRKIPFDAEKNKGTIHFANDVFKEIRSRISVNRECAVVTFDIKSFFSTLNHARLKRAWMDLFGFDKLPDNHYKVFKASTDFHYVLLDDLRKYKVKNGKKSAFDEKRLAEIRNRYGIMSFFESALEFRKAVKNGELPIYRNPFFDKSLREIRGIPQGLPISAVLANLYLLEFDLKLLRDVVGPYKAFYRRYSDDIIVLCSPEHVYIVKKLVEDFLLESKVELSKEKTETFLFKENEGDSSRSHISAYQLTDQGWLKGKSLTYLGFEFNGNNIFIKSANLARFYRRMINAVRSKARIAIKIADKENKKPVIFKRQLYELYSYCPITKKLSKRKYKRLKKNKFGEFRLHVTDKKIKNRYKKNKPLRSNYLSYVKRASEIMNEVTILRQLRKHKRVLNQAILKHLKKEPNK